MSYMSRGYKRCDILTEHYLGEVMTPHCSLLLKPSSGSTSVIS